MGLIQDESPIPETYFGPMERTPWWDPAGNAENAVYLDRDVTSDEALVKAGIAWTVSKRPTFYGDPIPSTDKFGPATHRMGRWMATVRDTDDAYLGNVMPGFRVFQQAELAALGDELLGRGDAYWHTGGSLYGGKLVWLLAKFDKAIHVKGDGSPLDDYLLLINGHDGRHGCTALTTITRVWCGNTAAQAIAGARDKVTLRHTSGMEERVPLIREVLDVHVQYRETLEQVLNRLAERPMTIDEVRQFTTVLIPTPPDKERAPRLEAKRDLIVALFDTGPTLEGVPLTAYRAYSAVAEYADHYAPYRDTKLARGIDRAALAVIEGPAYDLKTDAVRLLLQA